jgi:uncharacterized membrane protein
MSQRIERSISIAAPAQAVWDVVQDVSRRLEWDARVVGCEVITDGPFGKNSRASIAYNLFGFPVHVVMEMVTWAPPHRSAARALPNPMGSLAGSWRFDERPDGSTVFTTTISLRCETGILRELRERILRNYMDRLTVISQSRLKRLIEAEQQSTEPATLVAVSA